MDNPTTDPFDKRFPPPARRSSSKNALLKVPSLLCLFYCVYNILKATGTMSDKDAAGAVGEGAANAMAAVIARWNVQSAAAMGVLLWPSLDKTVPQLRQQQLVWAAFCCFWLLAVIPPLEEAGLVAASHAKPYYVINGISAMVAFYLAFTLTDNSKAKEY